MIPLLQVGEHVGPRPALATVELRDAGRGVADAPEQLMSLGIAAEGGRDGGEQVVDLVVREIDLVEFHGQPARRALRRRSYPFAANRST